VWVSKYQLMTAALLLSLAATAACANPDEAPSEELLEFLGEFQTGDGDWIDPLDLLDVSQSDIQQNDVPRGGTQQTELKRNNEEQSDE
jgi:hypothetical protein